MNIHQIVLLKNWEERERPSEGSIFEKKSEMNVKWAWRKETINKRAEYVCALDGSFFFHYRFTKLSDLIPYSPPIRNVCVGEISYFE